MIRIFFCFISGFSLLNLKINRFDVVAECCTHFYEMFVWGKKIKTEVGTEAGKKSKRIKQKDGHICVEFFLISVPT